MRPTLEDQLASIGATYTTAEEMRQRYAATPVEVRRLFTDVGIELETDAWLVFALQAGAVPFFSVPNWVDFLVMGVSIPTIEIYPSKSPGSWRINSLRSEWYVYSEDLARACR